MDKKESDALVKSNKELEKKVKDQEKEIAELRQMVQEINEGSVSTNNTDFGSVKVGGETYDITMPGCNMPGKGVITAEDIKTNKELAAELVEMKAGILKLKEVQ